MILIRISGKGNLLGIDLEKEKYLISPSNKEFCLPQAIIDLKNLLFG